MSSEERDKNLPPEPPPNEGGSLRPLDETPGSYERPEERLGNELGDTADSVTRGLRDLQDELMPPEPPGMPPPPPIEREPVGSFDLPPAAPVPPSEPVPPTTYGTADRGWRREGTADPSANDDDRLLSMLAWLSLVVLQLPVVSVIQLLSSETQRRPFQRHHAITSLLFFAAGIAYEIVAAIVFAILTTATLGCLAVCLWVIFFVPHLLALYYAFQAYGGKRVELPYLSALGRRQGWL